MTFKEWIELDDRVDKQGGIIKNQWTGLDELKHNIDMSDVTIGSGKKLLWKCEKGHTWLAKITHRTQCLSGCPMCNKDNSSERVRNKRVKIGFNDLLTWCNNNDKRGQQLISEFIGDTEDNIHYNIDEITYGSKIKIKWKCSREHTWYATVNSRTNTLSNCPYCSGSNIIKDETDLYTWCINHSRQELINEFVGSNIDGENIDMHNIKPMSHKKVYWEHYKNGVKHKWLASVRHRTLNNSGCPYCNGSKRVQSGFNDLLTWCKNNIDFGKVIMEQYTGIDVHGNKTDIDKIAPFSYSKLLWRHKLEDGGTHEWYASLYNRISHRTMCPLCNNKGTSFPEQVLYRCIKQVYPNTISRGKFKGYEFDIAIPELKTCIEYGSYYYHKEREQRDIEKLNLCKEYGVRLISITEDNSIDKSDEICEHNKMMFKSQYDKIKSIKRVVKFVAKELNIKYEDIDVNIAIEESIEFMKN